MAKSTHGDIGGLFYFVSEGCLMLFLHKAVDNMESFRFHVMKASLVYEY